MQLVSSTVRELYYSELFYKISGSKIRDIFFIESFFFYIYYLN